MINQLMMGKEVTYSMIHLADKTFQTHRIEKHKNHLNAQLDFTLIQQANSAIPVSRAVQLA